MALERENPIPPGWYYVDLLNDMAQTQFHWWVRTQLPDHVKVRKREGKTWALFEVLKPVTRWVPESGISLPTRAPKKLKTTFEGTSQARARNPSLTHQMDQGLSTGLFATSGLGWAIVLYLISQRK